MGHLTARDGVQDRELRNHHVTNTAQVFLTRGQVRGGITDGITTAGAITYTVDQMFSGLTKRNCNGASRSDSVPTPAAMIAGLPGAVIGTCFEWVLKNTSPAAETITIVAPAGVFLSGTMTIPQLNAKRFRVEVTNATPGAEAYTLDAVQAASAY